MKTKAKKFIVIEAYVTNELDELIDFCENVNSHLAEGWQLFGDTRTVSVVKGIDKLRFTLYSQTLIKD